MSHVRDAYEEVFNTASPQTMFTHVYQNGDEDVLVILPACNLWTFGALRDWDPKRAALSPEKAGLVEIECSLIWVPFPILHHHSKGNPYIEGNPTTYVHADDNMVYCGSSMTDALAVFEEELWKIEDQLAECPGPRIFCSDK